MKQQYLISITFLSQITLNQEQECSSNADCPISQHCNDQSTLDNPFNPPAIRAKDISSVNVCVHNNITALSILDIVGLVLLVILCIMANAGGVGGGFIQIVIVLYMFNFNTVYGTPLIQVLVFGVSCTKFVLDLFSDHPKLPGVSLMCWDIIILSMPALLAGKILGLMANIIFPEWLIIVIFILVLINDFRGTFIQQLEIIGYQKEQKVADSSINSTPNIHDSKQDELKVDNKTEIDSINNHESLGNGTNETNPSDKNVPTGSEIDSHEETIIDDQSKFPMTWGKLALLIVTCVANIITTQLRGGNKSKSIIGLTQCEPTSWVIFGFQLVFDLGLVAVAGQMLRNQEEPSLQEEERVYSWSKIWWLNALMIQCGVISGVLGIGGGLLIGPLMLTLLRLRPEVQTSSSNALVFFGTISGVLQLFILGTLQQDWAIALAVISFASALASKFIFNSLAKKLGPSVFVLALLIIIGLALFTTPILTIFKTVDAYRRDGSSALMFADLCKL